MASDREKLQAMADRLRGLDQKAAGEARQIGQQLSEQQVGKMQNASEIKGPNPSPRVSQDQPGTSSADRHRHILDAQQKDLVGSPRGDQAATTKTVGQEKSQQTPAAPEKSMQTVAKDKNLAEIAQKLREAGVTQGRASNDVAPPKRTPEVEKEQSRGRGR